MTPQIPGYLLSFESLVRPLVTIIALGLIWLGAARMPASVKSRYTTAGMLSVVLMGWVAVAQYLGAANAYLATIENPPRDADRIVRFADPARCRRHCPVAIGKHRKAGLRDPAALAPGGSGLPRRGWNFFPALGCPTAALDISPSAGEMRLPHRACLPCACLSP